MKISVACCVFNGETFLERQLLSLVEQDRPPDEIVVVDDGSTDQSPAIVMRFADRCPSTIRVIHERNERNLGVTRNFEKALGMTTGDLVFPCDQDDVWSARKLARMEAAFAQRHDLTLLHTDARLIDENDHVIGDSLLDALEVDASTRAAIHADRGFAMLLRRNVVTGATLGMRRALLDLARPFPDDWLHDEWLAIVAASTGHIDLDPTPLIDYRQHGRNVVGARKLRLSDKVARLARPRGRRYQDLERRAATLAERLPRLPGVAPAHIDAARAKVAHMHARATLPRARWLRAAPVLGEAAAGRYDRYSLGWRSVLQDLLEPA